jgi:membrane protease YdiL (CAAX protease family)
VLPIVAVWPKLKPPDQGIFGDEAPGVAGWIALVVVVCIGAPFIEELFFRGLVQTRLVGRLGAVPGIAITSALFGAAHLIGWVGPITIVFAVAITGAGLVFGLLRHLTGRLGPSIVAHCVLNAQALLVLALLD